MMKFCVSSKIGYDGLKKCRWCADEAKNADRQFNLPNPTPPCSSAAPPKWYRVNKHVRTYSNVLWTKTVQRPFLLILTAFSCVNVDSYRTSTAQVPSFSVQQKEMMYGFVTPT